MTDHAENVADTNDLGAGGVPISDNDGFYALQRQERIEMLTMRIRGVEQQKYGHMLDLVEFDAANANVDDANAYKVERERRVKMGEEFDLRIKALRTMAEHLAM